MNPNEICERKYRGPLCQTCNKNYAKLAGFHCTECYSKTINFLVISVIILSLTTVLSIYIKYIFKIIIDSKNFNKGLILIHPEN